MLGAAAVLSGPALAAVVAGLVLNANNATLALAISPVVIAVVVRATEHTIDAELTALLWPGLAGVAGLLLMVPEPSFGAWRPWLGMATLPLVVGGGSVAYARSVTSPRLAGNDRTRLVAGLACAGLVLGVLAWVRLGAPPAQSLFPIAAGLDGLLATLTLVALERLGAVRWSAQFLLVPLVGLLEGIVLLRPMLDWRSYVSLGLLALSFAYQWLAFRGTDPEMLDSEQHPVPEP